MSVWTFGELAASLTHKADPDRIRTNVWADSHDVDHWKAKPFLKILDGTRESKNAFGNSMLLTLDDDIVQQSVEAEAARKRGEERDPMRLLDVDRRVLAYMVDKFNHETGMLYLAQSTIAEDLGLSSPSVANDSLQRLAYWGYISWVRRSVKIDTNGQPGRSASRPPMRTSSIRRRRCDRARGRPSGAACSKL